MTTTEPERAPEPTAPAEPEWQTCKTHDVKWDKNDQQGDLEYLNHNEVYGCEVVDGEHTTQDEENVANQSAAAEETPDVETEEVGKQTSKKSPYSTK